LSAHRYILDIKEMRIIFFIAEKGRGVVLKFSDNYVSVLIVTHTNLFEWETFQCMRKIKMRISGNLLQISSYNNCSLIKFL
jgi:hypothetical protein